MSHLFSECYGFGSGTAILTVTMPYLRSCVFLRDDDCSDDFNEPKRIAFPANINKGDMQGFLAAADMDVTGKKRGILRPRDPIFKDRSTGTMAANSTAKSTREYSSLQELSVAKNPATSFQRQERGIASSNAVRERQIPAAKARSLPSKSDRAKSMVSRSANAQNVEQGSARSSRKINAQNAAQSGTGKNNSENVNSRLGGIRARIRNALLPRTSDRNNAAEDGNARIN